LSLTHCPECRRLCFINSESCASCGAPFRAGVLRGAAEAEEKSFRVRSGLMFFVPFAGALAALAFVLIRT
jgi:hypothetical protein